MELRKENWRNIDLIEVVEVVNGSTPKQIASVQNIGIYPFLRVSDMNLDGNQIYMSESSVLISKEEVDKLKVKLLPKDTIIFPKRGASIHTNKKRILIKDSAIDLNTMGFVPSKQLFPYFLFTWFQAINLSTISDGSYIPQINNRNIEGIKIPLPPLKEQKQIAALFQSIDNAIKQAEMQVKTLTSLRTKLAGELVSPKAKFGNLLNSENCNSCTLGDIAKESRKNTKSPLDKGIERFVGLEHIEPGSLKIEKWGNVADGTSFTKIFRIGDVLFGRRRAYLKKAACADFYGLCSGDITVLRATPELMLPELLPYYLSADPVFEYAVGNSAGSLSPRVKWRDLSKYELAIPALQIQKKILKVFHLIDSNIRQNKDQKSNLQNLKQNLLNEILG
jgi:type I restriction enzyme, S subunit